MNYQEIEELKSKLVIAYARAHSDRSLSEVTHEAASMLRKIEQKAFSRGAEHGSSEGNSATTLRLEHGNPFNSPSEQKAIEESLDEMYD